MDRSIENAADLSLPAQIAREGEGVRTVTISTLSEFGCSLREQLPAESAHGTIQLWLGAIGPLQAHQSEDSPSEILFDGPINPAIVAHFTS